MITDEKLGEIERVLKEKRSYEGERGSTPEEVRMIRTRNALNDMVLTNHHEELISAVRELKKENDDLQEMIIHEVNELKELLRELEWSGWDMYDAQTCPTCKGLRPTIKEDLSHIEQVDHKNDCKLAEALK